MRPAEKGFLLLTSDLGNPDRKPLSVSQLRKLADAMAYAEKLNENRELLPADLTALGYSKAMAERIVHLLNEEELLSHYLFRARKAGCKAVSRISDRYPPVLRKKLGWDAPGCLWAKGDLLILDMPKVSLVGSREISMENRRFAETVGREAAKQGYALVSGNARGADKIAQDACLQAGGFVISVVADALDDKREQENLLYLSELDFDQPFSAQRALRRNRVIHVLGEKTFVAQSELQIGGTWDGTVKNLQNHWSPVFCFADGSLASASLHDMGATLISFGDLQNISALENDFPSFMD